MKMNRMLMRCRWPRRLRPAGWSMAAHAECQGQVRGRMCRVPRSGDFEGEDARRLTDRSRRSWPASRSTRKRSSCPTPRSPISPPTWPPASKPFAAVNRGPAPARGRASVFSANIRPSQSTRSPVPCAPCSCCCCWPTCCSWPGPAGSRRRAGHARVAPTPGATRCCSHPAAARGAASRRPPSAGRRGRRRPERRRAGLRQCRALPRAAAGRRGRGAAASGSASPSACASRTERSGSATGCASTNLATPEDAANALAQLQAAGLGDAYVLGRRGEPATWCRSGVFADPRRAAEVAATWRGWPVSSRETVERAARGRRVLARHRPPGERRPAGARSSSGADRSGCRRRAAALSGRRARRRRDAPADRGSPRPPAPAPPVGRIRVRHAGRAGLAQLVVHLTCNQEVGGSNPSAGTIALRVPGTEERPWRSGKTRP